jgi:acetyl-CoA synthetase
MFYLSALAEMKPIIEYCGGTEIGGGYVTSVRSLPNVPSAFNTPAIGLDFVLVDDAGRPADAGEVFLVPPSIGLSTTLLNGDHHRTYYESTPRIAGYPVLRRHGDHITRLVTGDPRLSYYVAGGRVDDTMNLGGIKISSAEIERVLNSIQGIVETAAVAVADQGGLDNLVVFYIGSRDPDDSLLDEMNVHLKNLLNPLFRVQRIVQMGSLPRTASGKVMRRKLRNQVAS